jgi:hypothetical protein
MREILFPFLLDLEPSQKDLAALFLYSKTHFVVRVVNEPCKLTLISAED